MKIGIFTQPLLTNYGCILQNYAMQRVLCSLGHDTVTIEKPKTLQYLSFWRMPLAIVKRALCHYLLRDKKSLVPLYEWSYNRDLPVVCQYTWEFVSNYITTRKIDTLSEISQTDYDAFIVGSDQVWRFSYNRDTRAEVYLTFTSGWKVKRIAYAASLGVDKWEMSSHETDYYKPFVQNFDAVSVRESSSVDLLSTYMNVKAIHVLDPTMLLSRSIYVSLAKSQSPSDGTLMVHVLDTTDEKTAIANTISRDMGLRPFAVSQEYSESNLAVPREKRIQPPVEKWLRGFMDAEVVFTDSFHACVFSILFNKPFVVYCNAERGAARFESLLDIFGLKHLMVFRAEDYSVELLKSIDFEEVNRRLEMWRNLSIDFLRKALEG